MEMTVNHNPLYLEIANTKKQYELLNIRYYEHLKGTYHISWSDTLDKNANILLKTQMKVALLNDVNSKKKGTEDSDKTFLIMNALQRKITRCIS